MCHKVNVIVSTDLVGHTIGGYRLTEEIGAGGLATVYKAYQQALQRWVAVKILHYQEHDALLRFEREAQTVAKLRHRNILMVYDHGEDDGWPFIVMEYIEGGTLSQRLIRGVPMNWFAAVKLAIPVAEALQHAHLHGLVHRDVKPSNILMAQDDWPLLADFGLVKLAHAQTALTGTGISMGTPSYISPEQARGGSIDHRADIYSLAIMLFEMVTGTLPFDYGNPNKILMAQITETPPLPSLLNPHCPPILETVLLKALAKSPDERYEDMTQFVKALEEALTSSVNRPMFYQTEDPEQSPAETQLVQDTEPELEAAVVPPSRVGQLFLIESKRTIRIPDRPEVIVGRTYGNKVADIDLEPYGAMDLGVSRHHARLIRNGGSWLLEDLGSLNGTFVNDTRLEQGRPSMLEEGDVVRLSHISMVFMTVTQH